MIELKTQALTKWATSNTHHRELSAFNDGFDAACASISSAPDLLSALVELLAMCERQDDFNDDGDGRMFERAGAAIAKATGAA